MRDRNFCLPLLLAILIAQAGNSQIRWPIGWSYDANPKWPGAIYRFPDGKGRLIYRCHSGPVAILMGDYSAGVDTVELVIGERKRTLDLTHATEAEGLFVLDANVVRDMALARAGVTFRTRRWIGKAPFSNYATEFLDACKKLRTKYPAH